MKCYFKSRSTFEFLGAADVVDYNLCLVSIYDNTSEVTIVGHLPASAGDFFIFKDFIGVIKSYSYNKGVTSLVVDDVLELFGRQLLYVPPAEGESIEQFIYNTIDREFIHQEDEMYALPYVTIKPLSTSTEYMQPDLQHRMYSMKAYIAYVRRLCGVFTSFKFTNEGIEITIGHKITDTHIIDFDMSGVELTNESFSNTSISKIMAVADAKLTSGTTVEDGDVNLDDNLFLSKINHLGTFTFTYNSGYWYLDGNIVDLVDYGIVLTGGTPVDDNTIAIAYTKERQTATYYRMTDGTITKDPTEGTRAEGEWVTKFVDLEERSIPQSVMDEFSKNTNSFSIEFFSDTEYEFYDKVRMRIHGTIIESYISQRYLLSTDERYFYKCGSMQVTFTEKQLEVI